MGTASVQARSAIKDGPVFSAEVRSGQVRSGQGSLTGGLRPLPRVGVLLELRDLAVGNVPHMSDLCVESSPGPRSGEHALSVESLAEPCHVPCSSWSPIASRRRLRHRWPGISAAAQPPKARAAHAGPHRNVSPDQHGLYSTQTKYALPAMLFPRPPQLAEASFRTYH
jgi:hypothetical protein